MTAASVATLVERLAALAPAGCRVGWRPLRDDDLTRLAAAEAALMPSAGPLRRREFASGRALLHALLADRDPILRGPNGAPVFPTGTVGSLAHDRNAAVAVVASSDDFSALGIDLEHAPLDGSQIDEELREAVLRDDDAVVDPLAAFVIKEAAYKAYSASGGPMVGPLDVHIEVAAGDFRAHLPRSPGVTHVISGIVVGDETGWVALAIVRR